MKGGGDNHGGKVGKRRRFHPHMPRGRSACGGERGGGEGDEPVHVCTSACDETRGVVEERAPVAAKKCCLLLWFSFLSLLFFARIEGIVRLPDRSVCALLSIVCIGREVALLGEGEKKRKSWTTLYVSFRTAGQRTGDEC